VWLSSERGAFQILKDVAKRDGVLGLWSSRIIFWKSSYAVLNRGLMYMSLSWLSSLASARYGQLSMGTTMVLAYVADLLTKPLVAPLETLVIRLNRSETGETVRTLVPLMLKQGGVGMFFRGLPTHLGSSWRQAMTEAIFEQLRRAVGLLLGGHRRDGELGAAAAFAIGWLSRGLATVIVQPLFRVRNMATHSTKPLYVVALEIYSEKGFNGFFAGCVPEIMRGATLQACLNLVKEHLTVANRRGLVFLGV
jgi:hypothetical protein